MARIVLCPYGSSGDLNPSIVAGLELRQRGHTVAFVADSSAVRTIAPLGFELHELPPLTTTGAAPTSAEMFGGGAPETAAHYLVQCRLLPRFAEMVAKIIEVCRGADLVINGNLQPAAPCAAEYLGIPWGTIAISPMHIPAGFPTSQHKAQPGHLIRSMIGEDVWTNARAFYRDIADDQINEVRRHYGLPPTQDNVMDAPSPPQFVSVPVSTSFIPPDPEWPDYVAETGFCFWDHLPDWTPPPDLEAFLTGPTPVIACSTGSMSLGFPKAFMPFFQASLKAIREVGARALIIGALPVPQRPDPEVFMTPYAPFSYVYQRCATVIHHGGIGSIAQALRAGIPMLVVPWGADQPPNAKMIEATNTGLVCDRTNYDVASATAALQRLITAPDYRKAAQGCAVRIAAEDGRRALGDLIEQHVPAR